MITLQLLEGLALERIVDSQKLQRGVQYFREGRVYHVNYNNDKYFCKVKDNYFTYTVNISENGWRRLEPDICRLCHPP